MDTGTCTRASLHLGEDIAGTAPHVNAWLLVEQPGPWGRRAPSDSRLDPAVAAALERAAGAVDGLRVQLVRRPDGRVGTPRTAFVCGAGDAGAWLRRRRFNAPDELLDLDLAGAAAGIPPAGTAGHGDPVYLVCTNGARDRCCAEVGRPLAAALRARFGDAVWETTHVGGHRFAGNVVCLPDGTYYGRLDPDTGGAVLAAHRDGRLALDHLRGRAWLPAAAQAAEVGVRRARGLAAADAVAVETVEAAAGATRVLLRAGAQTVAATVRHHPTGRVRPVSCGGEPDDPGRFEVDQPVVP